MKILAIEKEYPGIPAEAFKPFLMEEAQKVWEFYKKGIIREIYFRGDRSSAVLVLECKDSAYAGEILNSLPLAANNLIKFEIIPLIPYPGFERLFEKTSPQPPS